MSSNQFTSILYSVDTDRRVANITLNRPDKLNAINNEMPREIRAAVALANADDNVHVIILSGAGRSFCAGYDLELYAETPRPTEGSQSMPWDPMIDFEFMYDNTQCFMSLWRSYKPVIGKVHGFAVAGGSDIALCCDILIMGRHARIGYPPARVWGCPTTAMWLYRAGMQQAKRLLFTGEVIGGEEAERLGIALKAVSENKLDAEVNALADRMASVPRNQLMMHKLMINQAYSNMGIENTQMLSTWFDGITRHTPEGVAFKAAAEKFGFKAAVRKREAGEDWQ
ncbi:MAG: crotonase/enoyl-CoA hydratase family protein [Leptospiraceae bacterium]|nr:crotonase/enoyl-CoA hydratase family protein [Leptospiraceae bacterium]